MKNISLSKLIHEKFSSIAEMPAISSDSTTVNYGDLASQTSDFQGKSVILYFHDVAMLLRAMAALDGFVEALCPLSEQITNDDLRHIVSLNAFDVVVTDMPSKHTELFSKNNIRIRTLEDLDLVKEKRIEVTQTTNWLVPTSGTTSKPKLVRHTLSSLAAAALSYHKHERDSDIWGLFYDPTRYAGYQVLFRSLLGGQTLIAPSLSLDIIRRVQICIDQKVSHISATPTMWRKILMCPPANGMPLRGIILGGEAADQPTLDALRSMYPTARITHVYASTEAGLGMSVSDGLAGFPLRFKEDREAKAKIKIEDNRLYLSSPSTASSYLGEKEFISPDGWVDTGDLVTVEGDRFFVVGRASGVINIGGDKVLPDVVRQQMLEHPDVVDVHIYGKKNPFTGMLLGADVKLNPNIEAKVAERSIRNHVQQNIPETQQPRFIRFVDDIKINSTGKIEQRKE